MWLKLCGVHTYVACEAVVPDSLPFTVLEDGVWEDNKFEPNHIGHLGCMREER